MSLVEICNSHYEHSKLEIFGKKYFNMNESIICEECIGAYIKEVSSKLADIILKIINNINMKDIVTVNENDYRDNQFNIETNLNIAPYMEHRLPIKYSLKARLFCDKYVEDIIVSDIDKDEESNYSLDIQISSINCPDQFPIISIHLDIRNTDSKDYIQDVITKYLTSYIKVVFNEMDDALVKSIMSNYGQTQYSSSCSCATSSAVSPSCSICNRSISMEHYIYNNRQYCLDCMYSLVVSLAHQNNITDDLGLSIDNLTSNKVIINTPEWKRSVISKYTNTMAIDNIVHCQMTITG